MSEKQTTYTAEEWREEEGPSERELQQALVEWARMQPSEASLLYAVPNGQYRPGQAPEPGLKPGVPDLCLPVPSREHGALYLELKVGSNTTTDAQEEMIEKLRAAGNRVVVCRELQNAMNTIREYLSHE
jgi:hypothetical protein